MDGNAEPLQPQPTDDAATTDGLDRRAILLAGGAALAGAAAAALAGAERADAGHNTDIAYDTQTVMHVDVTNTTAGSTRVSTEHLRHCGVRRPSTTTPSASPAPTASSAARRTRRPTLRASPGRTSRQSAASA